MSSEELKALEERFLVWALPSGKRQERECVKIRGGVWVHL